MNEFEVNSGINFECTGGCLNEELAQLQIVRGITRARPQGSIVITRSSVGVKLQLQHVSAELVNREFDIF